MYTKKLFRHPLNTIATLTGELIPAPTEKATATTARAIILEQEAAQAKRKAERLRHLGVNPN